MTVIQFVLITSFCVILVALVVFIGIVTTKIAFELGDSLAEYWDGKLRTYLKRKLKKEEQQ